MKKIILTVLATMFLVNAFAQSASMIMQISDSRIPDEVREKLRTITSPEELEKFSYNSSYTNLDKNNPGAQITTSTDFHFSNGQIVGKIVIKTDNIGYQSEKKTYQVDLCYMFCCTDKTNKENCTQDYNLFKQWMANPDNCKNSRTTACQ